MQPAAAGPLGDERPLVLGDGPADLEQQLVLRVVGERPVGELDPAAAALQLLQKQDLVDGVAGQPVGVGDEDAVELGRRGEVAELVEAGATQRRPGVPVVAEDVVILERPLALRDAAAQAVELLVDGLRLGLALGRDPGVDRGSHRHPPGWWVGRAPRPRPVREAFDRRGRSAAYRRGWRGGCGAPSRLAS